MLFNNLHKINSTVIEDEYVAKATVEEIKHYDKFVSSRHTDLGLALKETKNKKEFSKFVGHTIISVIIFTGAAYFILYMLAFKLIVWIYIFLYHAIINGGVQ
jgi:hypothetical protein